MKTIFDRLLSRWYVRRSIFDAREQDLQERRDYWLRTASEFQNRYARECDRNRDLEKACMALADARAQQAVEKILADCVGETNQQLLAALTDSRGAEWAGADKPTVEKI